LPAGTLVIAAETASNGRTNNTLANRQAKQGVATEAVSFRLERYNASNKRDS